MAVVTEFKEFLLKTNALALAIGVVIGGAIGKVVSSIVADLLMPIIGIAIPGGAWRTWQIVLTTDAEGKPAAALSIGNFLGSVVDFVIIGFAVFMMTKMLIKPEPAPAPAPTKSCPQCLETVPAGAKKCRACTSPL